MTEAVDRDVTGMDAAATVAYVEYRAGQLKRALVTGPAPSAELVMETLRTLDQLAPVTRKAVRQLLELGKDRGVTWEQLGSVFTPPLSRAATQNLYRRCGGTRSWQTLNSSKANQAARFDLMDTGEA